MTPQEIKELKEDKMKYTKGEWTKQGAFIFSSEKPPRLIAEVIRSNMKLSEQQANARLIVTAVNACQKINPDNPLAVAESISDLYEALQKIVAEGTYCLREMQQDKPVRDIYNIYAVDRIARLALAKAEGE